MSLFYPVSIKMIIDKGRPSPFDVYVQRAEGKFTKIYNKNDVPDPERLKNYYENKQIDIVYIGRESIRDYNLLVDQSFEILKSLLNQTKPNIVFEQFEKIVECLSLDLTEAAMIDQKTINHASIFVKTSVKLLETESGKLAQLLKSFSDFDYSLKHSIIVSIVSLVVAKSTKITNPKVLEFIALAGLFHDISLHGNDYEIENQHQSKDLISEKIKQHPIKSAEILSKFNEIPSEVMQAVAQHHEMPNGQGYPLGLYQDSIYFPSRIVAIADRFCFLITKRENFSAMKGYEAIVDMMQTRGSFDKQVLKDFARTLNFKV